MTLINHEQNEHPVLTLFDVPSPDTLAPAQSAEQSASVDQETPLMSAAEASAAPASEGGTLTGMPEEHPPFAQTPNTRKSHKNAFLTIGGASLAAVVAVGTWLGVSHSHENTDGSHNPNGPVPATSGSVAGGPNGAESQSAEPWYPHEGTINIAKIPGGAQTYTEPSPDGRHTLTLPEIDWTGSEGGSEEVANVFLAQLSVYLETRDESVATDVLAHMNIADASNRLGIKQIRDYIDQNYRGNAGGTRYEIITFEDSDSYPSGYDQIGNTTTLNQQGGPLHMEIWSVSDDRDVTVLGRNGSYSHNSLFRVSSLSVTTTPDPQTGKISLAVQMSFVNDDPNFRPASAS